MRDMQIHLESLRRDADECQRISDAAAGDAAKRDLFARLAEHHRVLAAEVERAIAARQPADRLIDRSMLSRHLATTDRHIAEADREIAAQRADIDRLQRGGASTAQAIRVVKVLEGTQATHKQNRVRILAELDKPG
jgi:hypothetical protein